MAKNKHMTNDERLQIEFWLKEGVSIKGIAKELGRSTSTVSREIRARSIPSDKSGYGRIPNRCIFRKGCVRCQLCEDKPDCTRQCRLCKLCNSMCADFEEEVCLRLYEPPYVCNGCIDERDCTLRKNYYSDSKLTLQYLPIYDKLSALYIGSEVNALSKHETTAYA